MRDEYAEFWHESASNGKQYDFPYDDDARQSSDISITKPQYMIVAVGWQPDAMTVRLEFT